MKIFVFISVALIVFKCVFCELANSWGDISTRPIVGTTKSKDGFFLVKRSIDFEYPKVK